MLTSANIISGAFANRYIARVNQYSMKEALKKSAKQFNKLLEDIPAKKADYAYAPGKWTLKEVLQHVIDAERVFALRAVWFARKDVNSLPGFDENTWAANAKANEREWGDLKKEFKLLRKSTLHFFLSLDNEQLLHAGKANNTEFNVLGMGYLCAGHVMHHLSVIQERYLDKSYQPASS